MNYITIEKTKQLAYLLFFFFETGTSCNSDSLLSNLTVWQIYMWDWKYKIKQFTEHQQHFLFILVFMLSSYWIHVRVFQKLCWTLFTNKSNHYCRWMIASPCFVWNEFIYQKWWLSHMTDIIECKTIYNQSNIFWKKVVLRG